jgi:hypothetical protein
MYTQRVEELARWKMQALMGLVAISFSFLAEYIYSTPLLGVFMSGVLPWMHPWLSNPSTLYVVCPALVYNTKSLT